MGAPSNEEREEQALKNRSTWRAERESLKRELRKLRREHRTAFADGYRQGSGNAFGTLYEAAPSDAVCVFISQLSLGARTKKAPFNLSPEHKAEIRERVNLLMEKFGWSDEIATEKTLPL